MSGGSGNHTYYLPGNVEEVTPSNTLVKYYSAGGLALGENTATTASGISYLASDGLGSVTETLNQSGTATGSLLYGPYGGVRYTTGTMPTAKGFTGQYADAATGLDYYGARYYDPALGQFTSADTANAGLNRYGYVKGSPETFTDPTGHMLWDGGNVAGGGSAKPPKPVWINQRQNILDHYDDLDTYKGVVIDSRMFDNKILRIFNWPNARTPEQNKETDDAYVLAKYFRLSVIIQDPEDGKHGRRADYSVGILRQSLLPVGSFYMDYGTPMDLLYPMDTTIERVDNRVQNKASQAPVVVVDIDRNTALQQAYKNNTLDTIGAYMINPNRQSVPQRVIFIYNGEVVADYGQGWGPAPLGGFI